MKQLTWNTVNRAFEFEAGSFRDIYLLGTDLDAWQRMLDGLSARQYELAYFRDDQAIELPPDAIEVFASLPECYHQLSVNLCQVQANCHFFTPDDIEFNIDPREVKGQSELDAVFAFMRCLADSASMDAILTLEDSPDGVIFRVCPGQNEIDYLNPIWLRA